ncbi:hypothetical protein R1sor_006977 [Riccia sorocarpa]|uniref:Uncharacterized protein n=1 Tax=Riccia sorocarpa TaxID=122646 RepID=A0ABD3HT90_9MARC
MYTQHGMGHIPGKKLQLVFYRWFPFPMNVIRFQNAESKKSRSFVVALWSSAVVGGRPLSSTRLWGGTGVFDPDRPGSTRIDPGRKPGSTLSDLSLDPDRPGLGAAMAEAGEGHDVCNRGYWKLPVEDFMRTRRNQVVLAKYRMCNFCHRRIERRAVQAVAEEGEGDEEFEEDAASKSRNVECEYVHLVEEIRDLFEEDESSRGSVVGYCKVKLPDEILGEVVRSESEKGKPPAINSLISDRDRGAAISTFQSCFLTYSFPTLSCFFLTLESTETRINGN